ncbi:1-acylglycerol-3-phosphate O-acyltransferase SLC1 [Sugiyamaella lignohabitans]|uniref:1-acyl-sn-glycerol-3-phosphate acyltransferase n=1 Tax=Sugiyamaella lignohabitans TaxID=796027 RepID=A0A167EJJ5_9ASCO|nr:1-acylglycerol-3-phosphate O-acyltransferase SLC1 [Sugiyamaella lignohabitans]ANB14153.1 1-acylglycerol-3-phosphate O-acyltransferase SLC1 [Sugiyamaella lignohabitans]
MVEAAAVLKHGSRGVAAALVLGFFGVIKPLQFYSRVLVYLLLIAGCGIYGALASIVLTLAGKQGLSQWTTARVFYTLARYILGIKVVISNPEALKTRPAVFVSNHQSELDILILGATFPQYCSVTAKKALKYYPFLGWFMTLSGSVFIDRKNRSDALKAFDSAVKKVNRDKQSVFMFPEGTRSYYQEPGLLPLKKGAFHFAVQGQVPVVPFVASNYSKFFSFQKRIFEKGTIEIKVLDPIETKGMTAADVNSLYEKVQTSMKETVDELGYGSLYNDKLK